MRYEVVESDGEWVVRRHGVEIARFGEQNPALDDVARRLREMNQPNGTASLSMRFAARQPPQIRISK